MRLRLNLNWLLLLLAVTASAAPVSVTGRVVDPSGAAVVAAELTAYRTGEAAAAASAKSKADGSFALRLEAGEYLVHIESKGSLDATETLNVGSPPVAHDFVLELSAVRESITVKAPGGYAAGTNSSAMKTETPLREIPQSVSVVSQAQMQDQLMSSIGDVVRYVPGVTLHQGENNRDQLVMRGNSSSADFFVDGVRDDTQYYRDLYNLESVEVLKGPNALIFGRGGAGGVVNRVTKQAGFTPLHEIDVTAGAFENRRMAVDFNQPVGAKAAVRLNAITESSGSFRDEVTLKRSGVAPSFAFLAGSATMVTAGLEHFHDARVADRGIPSFQGKPADVAIETYFGNPADSRVRADVDLASASIEHHAGSLTIRNRTLFGVYDRGYQNYVPGAVSANKATVALSAYNNATQRRNLFNQFDVTESVKTGSLKHTLLAGMEIGRQSSANLRNTGYFNDTSTSVAVPYGQPTTDMPVTFRQSATDAKNHVHTAIAGVYAQDQIDLSSHVKVVGGLRFDRFRMDYLNQRNGDRLGRVDDMVSPRAGVIVMPSKSLSLYGSYSISYLPASGDQFSSLTSITKQLEPEQFANREVGVKWEGPSGLSFAGAVYRLDRTNTRSTDPNDPTRAIQTGSQRTNGFEMSVSGSITPSWSVAGGYTYQDAFVTSATASARAGATVGQVPRQMISLWNRYTVSSRTGLALGVIRRASMFAAIDNTVTLPGYTRLDAAGYLTLRPSLRLQLNVDNLLDARYYANADSNTNISPGSPRIVRIAMITRF
jgi:catecholate siderophore receptor